MSPNRGSCWDGPAVPKASPPSPTRPMLMFAWTAQVWKAWRISRCQTAVGCWALSVWNNELVWPAIGVPSGAKLSVSRLGSAQGTPKVAGTARPSRVSTMDAAAGCVGSCSTWLIPRGWDSRFRGTSHPSGPCESPAQRGTSPPPWLKSRKRATIRHEKPMNRLLPQPGRSKATRPSQGVPGTLRPGDSPTTSSTRESFHFDTTFTTAVPRIKPFVVSTIVIVCVPSVGNE